MTVGAKVKDTAGKIFIALGVLCIAAAVFLLVSSAIADKKAGQMSASVVRRLDEVIEESMDGDTGTKPLAQIFESNPETEMPTVYIDEAAYIGTIEIPVLELELPVLSSWSYDGLRQSPCRYSGSAYLDNMVIAAHNYQSHFGSIYSLAIGESVVFTDVDGNEFDYTVAATEILSPYDVDEMSQSPWALSMFTCTPGGQYRVTVRCEKSSGQV